GRPQVEPLKLKISIQSDHHPEESQTNYAMQYRDNGHGYPEGSLNGQDGSMGKILIDSMTRQLRANSESFNDDGAVFHLRFTEKVVSGS
ncbi:MAG: hypothetical protein AAFO91_06330, partial [Bacteroidota bacterium]